MKKIQVLKAAFFKVLILLIMICVSSCRQNNSIENTLKKK
jgi:hypothetical protein